MANGPGPKDKLAVTVMGCVFTLFVGTCLFFMNEKIGGSIDPFENLTSVGGPCLVLCLMFWKFPGGAGVGAFALFIALIFVFQSDSHEMRGFSQGIAWLALVVGAIASPLVGLVRRNRPPKPPSQ